MKLLGLVDMIENTTFIKKKWIITFIKNDWNNKIFIIGTLQYKA